MATNAREKCGGGIKQFKYIKKNGTFVEKRKNCFIFFIFFLKEVVLVLDNYCEGKMWSWGKIFIFIFFNLAKN